MKFASNPLRWTLLTALAGLWTSGCGTTRAPTTPAPQPPPVEGPVAVPAPVDPGATAGVTEEERVEALRYMELHAVDLSMKDMINNVVQVYKVKLPNVPDRFWKEFIATVDVTAVNNLYVEEVVRQFGLENLRAINDFLESEIGQTYLETHQSLGDANGENALLFGRSLSLELARQLRRNRYMY